MNIDTEGNRQSEEIARTLAGDIEELGNTVWFDQGLSGGQAWWDQILARVRECDVFVFVLDPGALNSVACKREYGYAADLGKPILPILVSDGVSTNLLPPALSKIQFVDYRNKDRHSAFRLARALTTIPPPKPLPNPLPAPPEAPISYLGSLTEKVEAPTLSYEEQSALVFDLKRSLGDPGTRDDALTLIEKLRKRRDLLATIAEEIDELLKKTKIKLSVSSQASETKPPSLEQPQKRETPSTPSESRSPDWIKFPRALLHTSVKDSTRPIRRTKPDPTRSLWAALLTWRSITIPIGLLLSYYGLTTISSNGSEAIGELYEYGFEFIFAEAPLFLYWGLLLTIAGAFGVFFPFWKRNR